VYPVTLHGPRLTLRELTSDDVDALHAVYGDPTTTTHLSFEPRTREQVARTIAVVTAAATVDPRVEYTVAAELHDDGLIGVVRLALETPHGSRPDNPIPPHAATIGAAIRADHQRHGLGSEALQLILHLGSSCSAFIASGVDAPRTTPPQKRSWSSTA